MLRFKSEGRCQLNERAEVNEDLIKGYVNLIKGYVDLIKGYVN